MWAPPCASFSAVARPIPLPPPTTTKILRLSQDLPVVIEIVDSQEKIDAFLPVLNGMISSGLVTLEKVQVLQYGTPDAARS